MLVNRKILSFNVFLHLFFAKGVMRNVCFAERWRILESQALHEEDVELWQLLNGSSNHAGGLHGAATGSGEEGRWPWLWESMNWNHIYLFCLHSPSAWPWRWRVPPPQPSHWWVLPRQPWRRRRGRAPSQPTFWSAEQFFFVSNSLQSPSKLWAAPVSVWSTWILSQVGRYHVRPMGGQQVTPVLDFCCCILLLFCKQTLFRFYIPTLEMTGQTHFLAKEKVCICIFYFTAPLV